MKTIHETLGGSRPSTNPNTSPELPAMPETQAEACELFGVVVTDPIHVNLQEEGGWGPCSPGRCK